MRNCVTLKGLTYYRWKRRGKRRYIRLPDPSSADFAAAFKAAERQRWEEDQSGAEEAGCLPRLTRLDWRKWEENREAGTNRRPSLPEWILSLANEARKRARKRGAGYLPTRTDLATLAARAGGHCELSGLPFSFEPHPGSLYRPFAPSIDRRDSKRGYELDNCRLVCVICNTAMNQWGEEPFWKMVEAAAKKIVANGDRICG